MEKREGYGAGSLFNVMVRNGIRRCSLITQLIAQFVLVLYKVLLAAMFFPDHRLCKKECLGIQFLYMQN